MLKSDSERAVRRLCRDWLKAQVIAEREHPSFLKFAYWLREHYPEVLSFRASTSPFEEAERWFNSELGQNWRE